MMATIARVAVALLAVLVVGCADEQAERPDQFDASDIIANGDGYSFRRISPEGTELLLNEAAGEGSFDEVVSVFARKNDEPVGPIDVMVLNEVITPKEWVDELYADLMTEDVSDEVGGDAILFTGSAIGAVMECRTEPNYTLIRGASTQKAPLIDLMRILATRCA